MAVMRKALKHIYYAAKHRAGLHKRGKTRNTRLLLMYHGVSASDLSGINGRHLPAKQFEEHLRYFKKQFRVVSLEEMLSSFPADQPAASKNAKPSICLTFDDGFENNLLCALPLLEKHNVPAAFFIPTLALERAAVLPADQVDIIRACTKERELEFAGEIYRKSGKHRLLHKKTGRNIYELLITLEPAQLEQALTAFGARYDLSFALKNTDASGYRLLNAEQVKELSRSTYATVGSHSRSHFALGTCPSQLLKEELLSSKERLEQVTGRKVNSLAFPYGNYNKAVIEQSKAAGYQTLLAAGPSANPPEILPRAGIISGGTLEQNLLHIHKGFDRFGF
jgi:peptidoglycan/xylan/chitin deacetylase (PgdA/CDA1 family)